VLWVDSKVWVNFAAILDAFDDPAGKGNLTLTGYDLAQV
jgi:hypothetical protein